MERVSGGRRVVQHRSTGRQRRSLVVLAVALALIGAACESLVPLGAATSRIGDDVASCAQFHPVMAAPCGPQPMYWAAIQGPYESHANGDPYATKCTTATGPGVAACDVPANPNGAANADYRASGYTYAIDVHPADIGQPITLQGWDVGQFARTITPNNTPVPESAANQALRDCDRGVAPFNTAQYYSGSSPSSWTPGFGTGQCQTGDSGTKVLNFDVQVFDNDGSDATVKKTTPLPSCHYRLLTTDPGYDATKNAWTTLCTFTPTVAGIYPFEVRDSGLSGVPDLIKMTGYNAFALRLTGSTATRLYSVGDASTWMNTVGSNPRLYLAEVKPEHKGKTMYVDLYDVGDGGGPSPFSIQLKAPAAGAPAIVPTGGTLIPSAGVATSCTYNPTKTASRATATTMADATDCRIVTKVAGSTNSTYNDGWLRVKIDLDPNYTCGTVDIPDCWWTLDYYFGASSFPSDRMVYRVTVG